MDISFLELYWCSYLLVKIGFFLELNLYSIHKSKLTTHGFFLVLFFPVLTYQRWILLGLILPCSLFSEIYSAWSFSSMLFLIKDGFFLVLFFHVLLMFALSRENSSHILILCMFFLFFAVLLFTYMFFLFFASSSYALLIFLFLHVLLILCWSSYFLLIFLFLHVLLFLCCSSCSLLFLVFFSVLFILCCFFHYLRSFFLPLTPCFYFYYLHVSFLAELDCTRNYSLLFSLCRTFWRAFFSLFWHHELTTRMITYIYLSNIYLFSFGRPLIHINPGCVNHMSCDDIWIAGR